MESLNELFWFALKVLLFLQQKKTFESSADRHFDTGQRSGSSMGLLRPMDPALAPYAGVDTASVVSPIICRSALAIEAHRGVASLANTLGMGRPMRLALRSDGCAQPATSDRCRDTRRKTGCGQIWGWFRHKRRFIHRHRPAPVFVPTTMTAAGGVGAQAWAAAKCAPTLEKKHLCTDRPASYYYDYSLYERHRKTGTLPTPAGAGDGAAAPVQARSAAHAHVML